MNKKKDELNVEVINESVGLLNKILKIMFILILIAGVYILLKLCQELQLKNTIIDALKTIIPVFIGLFVAWLFDPIVSKLSKKGMRRSIGAIIVYVVFIAFLVVLISAIIPALTSQINDFVKTIPNIFNMIKDWISGLFNGISIPGFDAKGLESELLIKLQDWGNTLANNLPNLTVGFVTNFFSGILSLVVGLIIGFYFLIGFDKGDVILTLLPKKMQKDTKDLVEEINLTCRNFITGAILDSTFVFIITSIAFLIVGLKSPLLFGLFCGLTNIIPYAGPYIGGAPAVIVGFSQGPLTGILTLVAVAIIQFLEGNFLQPVIMSKTTKLHPVTIIVGLLLFGHFFGIIGMVISTPLIGTCKAIFMYFNNKYKIINL